MCPYNSREGGYIFVFGGPYSAEEELISEFDEAVKEDIIKELAGELSGECFDWSGIQKMEDIDEYFFDFVDTAQNALIKLENSLEKLTKLIAIEIDGTLQQTYLQMIYVNVITTLEAYLSEFFIGRIDQSEINLRKFVESNPDFKNEKYSLSEIFIKKESLKSHVKEYLVNLLWHNLPKLKPMFRITLSIEFPKDIGTLIKSAHKRHDLVHRGGKTTQGDQIIIDKSEVEKLINEVLLFAKHIDSNYENNESF